MVNRKDFRPTSNLEEKPRHEYTPVKPKRDVVKSFIKGENAKTGNESLSSDGRVLKSYDTAIAVRQKNGTVVVNNTKYSSTTSSQQYILMQELKDSNTKYEVTGGKDRGYAGEDFSDEIKDENKGAKHYEKLAKENPEHADTLNRMASNEREHAKRLKEIQTAEKDFEKQKKDYPKDFE